MYWILAVALVVFGILGGFSIGAPFLLVGLALLVLGPVRSRRTIFWPPLAAVVVFVVTLALLVPFSCTASQGDAGDSTVCSSLAGQTWSGTGVYNPPPEASTTAFQVGFAAALAAGLVTLVVVRVRKGGLGATPPVA